MKILMLCPLLNSSSFITTYPFAKILSKKHDVGIIGPLFGKKPFIADRKLKFEFLEPAFNSPVQLGMLSLFPKNFLRLLKSDYDILHVFKLLPHTAPAAALSKKFTKKPFILTIDDYDIASPRNPLKKFILSLSERAYKSADAITVSSKFLQSIYGGEIIYQVANEPVFLNKRHSGKKIREKYGLEDKIIIVHAGSFYEHKGIDVLIKTVQTINDKRIVLLLVGNDNSEKYKKLAGGETIFTGHVPLEEIPDYIEAADIYAIPTKDSIYSRAEIPAKIFEAMMLGKAIVASKISDIPIILNNGECGMLVEPNNIKSLSESLLMLLDDNKLRQKLGKSAKRRYLKNYSYKQIEKTIYKVYSRVIK